MKLLISLLTLGLFAFSASGQMINYQIEEDDPDFANLVIGLEPFYIDMSRMNFPIGYGVSMMYTGKPIMLNASFQRAGYIDFNQFSINATPTLKKHYALELGAAIPFVRKTVNKDIKVTLSESSSGGYTTTRYITVPGTIQRVTALRGGLYRSRNSFDNEKHGDIVLDSVVMVASVHDYQPGVNQWEAFFSNVTVTALYAGISFTGTSNLRISSSDFSGTRSNAKVNQVYIDGFFAPFVDLGSYIHTPSGDGFDLLPMGAYDLNDAYRKNRLGFRIGWASNNCFNGSKRARIGLYSRMEAGARPGIRGGGWYAMLSVGLGINGKVGG